MSLLTEFKEFAVRGNAIDMAVGVIIGGAMGKMVTSLVGDVLMPPIGLILGGVNFSDLSYIIKEAVGETPAVVISYGKFIQTIVDFTIISFAIFMVVKFLNKLKRQQPVVEEVTEAAQPPAQEVLLAEIRDLLKSKQ